MKLIDNNVKKVNIQCKKQLIILGLLMMIDYLLTYIGINILGCIMEANPILIELFTKSFIESFTIRLIHIFVIILLTVIIYKYGNKYYKKFMIFSYSVNVMVLLAHVNWIIRYILFR